MIPVARPDIGEAEARYVDEAVRSGWVSSEGPFVRRFERAFARFVGTKRAVSTSSGTTALHLALHAMDFERPAEIIVPDMTYVATAHAALQVIGYLPVPVDVAPDTWCIDVRRVREAISTYTRAIVPVHLMGCPANMCDLLEITREHDGIDLLEDAAQAHGAYAVTSGGNRKVGSIGRAAVFSFYGNKIMTTGEGGMVTTDDEELADYMVQLKNHAMVSRTSQENEGRYIHQELGFNYNLTNLQAALGLAQLERASAMLEKRACVCRWYDQALEGSEVTRQKRPEGSVCWMVGVMLPEGVSRSKVMRKLYDAEVETRPMFAPMASHGHIGHRPGRVATDIWRRGIMLPTGTFLQEGDVARICEELLRAIR